MAKRNLEQNSLFHCHCRTIAEHVNKTALSGEMVSEVVIKGLVTEHLGNKINRLGFDVSMPTSSYRMSENDLTPKDRENGFFSFDELITKMVAWAATDLNLVLVSPNEKQDMVNNA